MSSAGLKHAVAFASAIKSQDIQSKLGLISAYKENLLAKHGRIIRMAAECPEEDIVARYKHLNDEYKHVSCVLDAMLLPARPKQLDIESDPICGYVL